MVFPNVHVHSLKYDEELSLLLSFEKCVFDLLLFCYTVGYRASFGKQPETEKLLNILDIFLSAAHLISLCPS
jgi:hypothetical protein